MDSGPILGTPPEALMARAGHSDYATTRSYVDLAGERLREEADRLEERLWGANGAKSRYEMAGVSSESGDDGGRYGAPRLRVGAKPEAGLEPATPGLQNRCSAS
jgi:hypothetical protein